VAEQLATATTPDAVRAVFEAARERETEADTEAAHLAEPLAEPLAEQEVPAVEVLASTERSTDVMDAVLRLMLERATALASAEAVSEVRALKAEIAQQLGA
jgi:hypothetical protein